jgi:hypothetical protein
MRSQSAWAGLFAIAVLLVLPVDPVLAAQCPPDDVAFAQQDSDPLSYYCVRLKQLRYAAQACAKRGQDYGAADECQYVAEGLISAAADCPEKAGPYRKICPKVLARGQALLGQANSNPVLTEENNRRNDARAAYHACASDISIQCAGQCGLDSSCTTTCVGQSVGQCSQ